MIFKCYNRVYVIDFSFGVRVFWNTLFWVISLAYFWDMFVFICREVCSFIFIRVFLFEKVNLGEKYCLYVVVSLIKKKVRRII